MDKAQTLRVILGGWKSQLPTIGPFGEPPVIAAWMLTQIPLIRKMDWATTLKDELHEALNDCRHATDRNAERVSLGECWNEIEGAPCGGTMMSIVGGTHRQVQALRCYGRQPGAAAMADLRGVARPGIPA